MSGDLLSIEGLCAVSERENGKRILRDVSLSVAPGEIHGLVGESGAGKSTIARAVLGMTPRTVRITSGAIILSNTELLTLDHRRLRRMLGAEVALIPQDPLTALNPSRRIAAQMMDGLRMWKGYSAKDAQTRALALLDEVQMREPERVMRCYPHELSGGMRQRVLIAAAFALEPKLVVADEPTTALDVTVQKQILRLIRAMQVRHKTGAIFVTHDLGVVAQICDRVTLLYQGKVIEQGTTAELLLHPRHPYTSALVRAMPRYDRPEDGLVPVPDSVIDLCRSEVAQFDEAAHV
jgi:peptide/nickel transport system ATP-binding protein